MRLPLSSKVVLLCSIGLLAVVTPLAEATETRLSTLKGVAGIQDEVEVFQLPSTLPRYQLALIELGSSTNQGVYGAAMAKVGGLNVGVAVSRSSWLFTDGLVSSDVSLFDRFQSRATSSDASTAQLLNTPERPFELLAALPVGPGTLGVRLAYAAINATKKSTVLGVSNSAKKSADHIQLGLGFGMGTTDFFLTIDPKIKQSRSDTAGGATTSTNVTGKTSVELGGRWLQSLETSGLYASGSILNRSMELKTSSAGTTKSAKFEDRDITLEGGYVALTRAKTANLYTGAVVSNVVSKGPSVTGIGEKLVSSHLTSDKRAEIKSTLFGGALSGEADITSGFGAMMGLHYILFGSTTESDDTTGQSIKTEKTFDQTSDAALWSLGAYFKADALRVDASYGKEFLHNGPYLISGATTKPLLGKISARYAF